jgi:hypothetical protein
MSGSPARTSTTPLRPQRRLTIAIVLAVTWSATMVALWAPVTYRWTAPGGGSATVRVGLIPYARWERPAPPGSPASVTIIPRGLAATSAITVAALGLHIVTYRLVRRRWILPAQHIDRCDECGYDLRGIDVDRCPECGEPIPPRAGRHTP